MTKSRFLFLSLLSAFAANAAVFNVRDFGAAGDGVIKDTAAVQRAIDAAHAAGGGEVLLPKGTYLCGSVFLKSDVDFHLAEGTTLKGSPDPADYNARDVAPQNSGRLGAGDNTSGGHLLLCIEQKNVTVRGPGKIDGNVGAFLKMPDGSHPKNKLMIPWRPSQMVWFVESRNIAIRDIELADAPYWSCFVYGCEDVTVENARIHTVRRPHTYNGDGLDIDSSRRVRVTGCNISTADDSITLRADGVRLKAAHGHAGRVTLPDCADVVVSNCTLSSDCNAIRLGVGNGHIRDCSFADIRIENTRYAVNAVGAWSRPDHGVDISNVSFTDMTLEAKGFCKFYYKHATHSVFDGITFRHIRGKVREPSIFDDTPARPFRNLRFEDVRLEGETSKRIHGKIVEDFNGDWEFSRDEVTWQAVEIPHDWAIEGPFDPEGDAHTGKLPWKGVGWYRKKIVLDAVPKGRRVFLDFDGVMCDGTAYVNGQPCGRQMYGYLGFRADATPYLYKGTNTIMVKADTTKLKSRWYPGAGMYRRVRKIETDDIYLDERDIAITTPDVSAERATVRVAGAVTSRLNTDAAAAVAVTVKSPFGEVVATGRTDVVVRSCGKGTFDLALAVEKPVLWEMTCPAALYTTEVEVTSGDKEDVVAFKTGLRAFRFDAKEGFFLNGRHVQLKGVCLHADLGILGMAYNRSAMRRQLVLMRDMGVNALRTSHNPPSPETLELCDEMGIFVWNECFDKWNATCGRGDEPLEEFVVDRLAEFVRRDRNHPCVFVWSIGNEIPNGGGFAPGQEIWNMPSTIGTTAERCARFRNAVLAEDATRLVGIGSCFPKAATEGHYASLDITGWNYNQLYDEMHRRYPDKPLIYSESASAFSDYGYYAPVPPTNKTDYAVADFSVDSYDRNAAAWSDIPDREFERMERDRFIAGEFVWTGVDYLGEPSPYAGKTVGGVPLQKRDRARSSYFGICDLLCFPKDRTYLYRSYWNKEAFTLHIVPDHWTFPERAGRKMPIYVYTSADEVELFLNGVSLGRRRKDPAATMASGYYAGMPRYRLIWNDVEWKPGTLKAVAYGTRAEDGSPSSVLGEETLRTAGAAAAVVLSPESPVLPDNRNELVFARVTLADANGTPVPRDNRRVFFAVEGPGQIVSVGNSNPHGLDSFKDVASHPLHNGRAGLAIRRTGPGEVRLTVSAEGLSSAVATFGLMEQGRL